MTQQVTYNDVPLSSLYTHIVGEPIQIKISEDKQIKEVKSKKKQIFKPVNGKKKRKTAYDYAKERAYEDSKFLQQDLIHKFGYESNL